MDDHARFDATAAEVERDLERLTRAAPPLTAAQRLFADEIFRSTALAGSTLSRVEVGALLDREIVAPGRSLAENVLVADYGEAARIVRAAAPVRRARPFVATDEIATLHATAVRRSLRARPGRWREGTARAFPSGMVPPPAWSVPREVAGFVDRFAAGPPAGTHPLRYVADVHARFLRIHPFDEANGRVARLVANLVLRRLELPPLVIRARDVAAYVRALRRADARDPWPLALFVARGSLDATNRLLAAVDGDLQPLATFATGARRAALYKAAQRGRLRAVREHGKVLTRAAWIADYES